MIRPHRPLLPVLRLPLALAAALAACSSPRSSAELPAPQPPAAASAALGSPGAAGIGDPLFPSMGNGGYDVERYELAIALERTDGPIDAHVTIHARATQDLSRFNLDLHGLEVRSVEVDGAPARFAREEDELVITPAAPLPLGADFSVGIAYGGVPEGVPDPSIPVEKLGWLPVGGELYVFSEPNGAKTFYPVNDHPRDKALYTLRITVPKPLTAVANGVLVETLDAGAARTFVWRARDPIASYLVTIAVGEFESAEAVGPDGLRIVNYFSPSSKPSSRRGFDKTPEIVAFLAEQFGPYPFEICGGILSSLNVGGALETQTIPVYGAGVGQESIICHELAHQWFGNTVSIESWSDIFLNEGFSEYASWMRTEAVKGKERFEKMVGGRYRMLRGMTTSPPGAPALRELFGLGTYVRGPLALHALRLEVGDEVFLRLLRTWIEQHRNGNATVEEFLAHVEAGSTPAARELVRAWLFEAEMPHLAQYDEAPEPEQER